MSLNCYSPTKRRDASPKKPSLDMTSRQEKPYAALDETQRSHAFRYNIGNNFYRDQVDRENAAKAQRTATKSTPTADTVSEKSLPAVPEAASPPGTTVTTFMMQMNQAEIDNKQHTFKLVPEADKDAMPTDRALIEARREAKRLRMMARNTETPKHPAELSVSEDDTPPNMPRQLSLKGVSHQRKASVHDKIKTSSSKDLQGEKGLRRKPGKLSFNISGAKGPSSISTTSDQDSDHAEAYIGVPAKAAKLLGTSNKAENQPTSENESTSENHSKSENQSKSSKWILNLHRRKPQRKRANTASSLPEKDSELKKKDITALPSVFPVSTSAEPDRNTSFEDTVTRVTIDKSFKNSQHQLVREESDITLPPTPPAKDTPPHIKAAMVALTQKGLAGPPGLGIDTAGESDAVSSIDFCKESPNVAKNEPTLLKHGAAEYAKIIEASPSLRSMQASVLGSPGYSKQQEPRAEELRSASLRHDGLTKEGYLPQTTYKPGEYSPSVYSTVMEPNEKGRSAKRISTLRTITDSPTYGNSCDPAKRTNSNTQSEERDDSPESVPLVYRLSAGEFIFENEDGGGVADEKDLVAQFPRPPRTSSLNWQNKPPPGARFSLIPSKIRRALAISELSMTTSDRVTDPALPNMSGNMRHDSDRPNCDGAGDDKPAFNDSGPTVNGTNGHHAIPDSHHGRQLSSGVEQNFQRSVGLTPYLAQQLGDNPNPISPGFNHPSAMPSPLAGPFPPTIPGGVPSHEQLLTHFHVLHYHLDDTFRVFRDVQKNCEEQVLGDNEKKFTDMRNAIDEYFADVRSHLNAIEHNMGRTTGETENMKNALDAHARSVDDHVFKPMRKLTNQNTELIKKVDGLQERVAQLERKLEGNPPAYGVGDNNRGHGSSSHNRPATDGPHSSFARPWTGYDASRHMVPAQQERQAQYTEVGGRYYNGHDPAQQHNYQDGYYGNGSYGNYMRSQVVTDGSDVDELLAYEDVGDADEYDIEIDLVEADTDSCSESSYRLVHSGQQLQQSQDQVLATLMHTMFNRNQS